MEKKLRDVPPGREDDTSGADSFDWISLAYLTNFAALATPVDHPVASEYIQSALRLLEAFEENNDSRVTFLRGAVHAWLAHLSIESRKAQPASFCDELEELFSSLPIHSTDGILLRNVVFNSCPGLADLALGANDIDASRAFRKLRCQLIRDLSKSKPANSLFAFARGHSHLELGNFELSVGDGHAAQEEFSYCATLLKVLIEDRAVGMHAMHSSVQAYSRLTSLAVSAGKSDDALKWVQRACEMADRLAIAVPEDVDIRRNQILIHLESSDLAHDSFMHSNALAGARRALDLLDEAREVVQAPSLLDDLQERSLKTLDRAHLLKAELIRRVTLAKGARATVTAVQPNVQFEQKRGIVVGRHVDIANGRFTTKVATEEEVMLYATYWDSTCFVTANELSSLWETRMTTELRDAGLIRDAHVEYEMETIHLDHMKSQGSVNGLPRSVFPRALASAPFDALERLNSQDGQHWCTGYSTSSRALELQANFSLPPSGTVQDIIRMELYSALPVPSPKTRVDKLIKLKEERRSELLAFRKAMSEMVNEIASANDSEQELKRAKEDLERTLVDLKRAMESTGISTIAATAKTYLSLGEFKVTSVLFGGALGMAVGDYLPVSPAWGVMAGLGSNAILTFLSRRGLRPAAIPPGLLDFAYLYHIKKLK